MALFSVSVVRGDTLCLYIDRIREADGSDHILSDSEIIFMDIKKADGDGSVVIHRRITAEDYCGSRLAVTLLPHETAALPIGDYLFDMRLFIDNKNIYTIIPESKISVVRNISDISGEG